MMTLVDLDQGRLEEAKEALEEMDEFGFQEDLEGFAQRLEQRWGWRLGGRAVHQPTDPGQGPALFRRRIAEDNRLSTGSSTSTRASWLDETAEPAPDRPYGISAVAGLEIRPRRGSPSGGGNAFVIGGYCFSSAAPTRGLAIGVGGSRQRVRALRPAPRRTSRPARSGGPRGPAGLSQRLRRGRRPSACFRARRPSRSS